MLKDSLFSSNLWVCLVFLIVTNTYIVMLGFMIEDRLEKFVGKLAFLKGIHFPCCNLRKYFFPFFLPLYNNNCLSPTYFIASTLNTARPSFSKKGEILS